MEFSTLSWSPLCPFQNASVIFLSKECLNLTMSEFPRKSQPACHQVYTQCPTCNLSLCVCHTKVCHGQKLDPGSSGFLALWLLISGFVVGNDLAIIQVLGGTQNNSEQVTFLWRSFLQFHSSELLGAIWSEGFIYILLWFIYISQSRNFHLLINISANIHIVCASGDTLRSGTPLLQQCLLSFVTISTGVSRCGES